MVWKMRRQNLVSQHIEVALVYKEMLGLDEASDYLGREKIPREIVERVLLTDRKRPSPMTAANRPAQAPYLACRRKNHVHDAIVEAALKIERKLGKAMALVLLKDEQVAETVVDRISAQGPRQLRVRRSGA